MRRGREAEVPPHAEARRSRVSKQAPAPVQLTEVEVALVRSLVICEDSSILVLNKPPGLSSQGGRAQVNTLDELLWAFAKPGHARPRLVHRLDRDTSGVILTAKTKPAAGFLGKAMMARRLVKTYVAMVGGGPPMGEGTIDVPLRREEIGREAYMRACPAEHADAEPALTRYRVLVQGGAASLLQLNPETGRMHQLRVHLAHLGCPILGDVRYGGALAVAGRPVDRLMLHAAARAVPPPAGGARRGAAPGPGDRRARGPARGRAGEERGWRSASFETPSSRAPQDEEG